MKQEEGDNTQIAVERNVALLKELVWERKRDLGDKYWIETTFIDLTGARDTVIGRVDQLIWKTENAIGDLSDKEDILEEIVRRHTIETAIDQTFLSEVLPLCDRYINTPEHERDEAFYGAEKEAISAIVEDLKKRKEQEKIERDSEEEHSIDISNNRTFKFFLSQDGESVRMEIPLVADPWKEQIRIGPEAVVKILGSKLTLEDYKSIAQTLLSLGDQAGRICRAYAYACDNWADLFSKGQEAEDAYNARQEAALNCYKVFGNENPRVAPFVDIPINAIFVYIKQKYPGMDQTLPQPFQS